MSIMNTLMFWKKQKPSTPVEVPSVIIPEQNIDDLIREASKIVIDEEKNLRKILEKCDSSIEENVLQKHTCEIKNQSILQEKENIELELPPLKACNSIKGIERREMRLIEINNEIESLTSIINELTNNIKELTESRSVTEKEYTKKINDIKLQINGLKAKKYLSDAEQMTNCALNGLNISGSKLSEIDKKLQSASIKMEIERRINSLNIPIDQR